MNILYYINYFDIFIYCLTALLIIIAIICILKILAIYPLDKDKLSTYECGFEANTFIRIPFEINFIILAVLYLIFDLEIIILIPAILNYQAIDLFIIFFFLIFLLLGFRYEWLRGTLEWF
jgi:NADH-quinone oxidoreductase subunit A